MRHVVGVLDLNKVAMAAVEQARPHIEERRHALTRRPAGGAGAGRGRPHAPDPGAGQPAQQLGQVHAGRRPITLAVPATAPAPKSACATTAAASTAQLLPHVFDLFTQADRAPDRSQGGLGIGLALVKSIVRMHDGSVAGSRGQQRSAIRRRAIRGIDAASAPHARAGGMRRRARCDKLDAHSTGQAVHRPDRLAGPR
jgi:hypothetical protein